MFDTFITNIHGDYLIDLLESEERFCEFDFIRVFYDLRLIITLGCNQLFP